MLLNPADGKEAELTEGCHKPHHHRPTPAGLLSKEICLMRILCSCDCLTLSAFKTQFISDSLVSSGRNENAVCLLPSCGSCSLGCDIAVDRRTVGMGQGDDTAVNKSTDKEKSEDS
jgi:hypothetical protein